MGERAAGEDTIDMEERDMGGRGDRSRAGRGGRQEGSKDQILRGPRQFLAWLPIDFDLVQYQ